MLPAVPRHPFRLADVMTDCRAALEAGGPGAPRAFVVVVIDGLGAIALREHAGHARTLAGAMTRRSVAGTVFPSTTAAALASLTTGTDPGEHGLIGYSALDPARGRTVNLLRDWGPHLVPEVWQPVPTVFERARDAGIAAVAIGPRRFAGSGFGRAILRGAEYVGIDAIGSRVRAGIDRAREPGRSLIYVYVSELDAAGHKHGVASPQWREALEEADAAVAGGVRGIPREVGVVVTADHGMIDVPESGQIVLDRGSLDGVRLVAGEPRGLQLHLEPGIDPADVSRRLADRLGRVAWVTTRAEAVDGGLFGPVVRREVLPRIGDVLVGARGRVAFFASDADEARRMVGQHGSTSPEETGVPVLRFGAGRL